MTIHRGLYVRQTGTAPTAVGTTPTQARITEGALVAQALSGQPKTGVIAGTTTGIVAGTTGMNYSISKMGAIINRANDEGVYEIASTGFTTVATTAAPGSNSRWDLVYVKQNDPDKGDADNDPVFGVVQGTVAASPTKPYSDAAVAAGSGALVLAEIQVMAGTVNTSSLTVTNVYTYSGFRGGFVRVANETDRNLLDSVAVGNAVQRMDVNGACIEYADSSASRWNSGALGVVRRVSRTVDGTSVGAGPTVDQVISSFTFKAGRKYLITWSGQHDHTVVPTNHLLQIGTCATGDADATTTGITVLGQGGVSAGIANIGQRFFIDAEYEPGSDTTVKVKAVVTRVSGTGNFVAKGSGTMPTKFIIYDMGNAVA
jgi:hypothetical protein